ncbi:MAG: precorrin-2 C(20)-methyltransferase [Pseudomonadota bacterium]
MTTSLKVGKLYGVGVGPGDPELMTLKAHRIIRDCPVIAYPAPDEGDSFARAIAKDVISASATEICMRVPMRVDRYPAAEVYDDGATRIAAELDAGRDVAVLCEGDPFFYGSFMYIYQRLARAYECEIVPGVNSLAACSSALSRPLTARNDVLTVLPGPLPDDDLRARIEAADAVAIMKVGRHLPRIRALLEDMGLIERAGYAERASLAEQQLAPLAAAPAQAPYFSMILIYKGAENWLAQWPSAPVGVAF